MLCWRQHLEFSQTCPHLPCAIFCLHAPRCVTTTSLSHHCLPQSSPSQMWHLRLTLIPPFPQSNPWNSPSTSLLTWAPKYILSSPVFLCTAAALLPTSVLAHFQSTHVVANVILWKSDFLSCLLKTLPLLPIAFKIQNPTMTVRSFVSCTAFLSKLIHITLLPHHTWAHWWLQSRL